MRLFRTVGASGSGSDTFTRSSAGSGKLRGGGLAALLPSPLSLAALAAAVSVESLRSWEHSQSVTTYRCCRYLRLPRLCSH